MGVVASIFPIFFFFIFGLVFAVVIVSLIKSLVQWDKNNHAPRLIVDSTVVTKRMSVSGHHRHGSNGVYHRSTSYSYYVTFQFESGDRQELRVQGTEYGMLVEGDAGKLTLQGTRYISFERV